MYIWSMKLVSFVILHSLVASLFIPEGDTLKILFLGDIMQHQAQLDAAQERGRAKLNSGTYDYSPYFKHLQSRFDQADLRVANMETTFAPAPYSGYPNFSSPSSLLSESKKSGIDLFLAANNHSCDKGKRGIHGSISLYDSLKVLYTGIYKNETDEIEHNPLIVEIRGFRIAFLNYTYGTNGIPVPPPFIIKQLDSNVIKKDIARTKEKDPDFIIACLHWGTEYVLYHSEEQEKWAKLFNKEGVNIIIGSHPHVAQDIDIKRELSGEISGITAYSLGNAISNMTALYTRLGMIFQLNLVKNWLGECRIIAPKYEYIWTTRPGTLEKNFSIIPVEDYVDKPHKLHNRDDYIKMKNQYLKVKND